MPVRKFRAVDAMPDAALCTPRDPANLRLACDLSVVATRLSPRRFPPGVHRHRSVDAAWEYRQQWERAVTHDPD